MLVWPPTRCPSDRSAAGHVTAAASHRSTGGSAQVLGDPDPPHSFSYTPDVAEALVALGRHEESLGKTWHLPVLEPSSTRALGVQQALGARGQIDVISDATLARLGADDPVIAELVEMTYQYKAPCILDDRRIQTACGLRAAAVDEAVASTARWAREAFAG